MKRSSVAIVKEISCFQQMNRVSFLRRASLTSQSVVRTAVVQRSPAWRVIEVLVTGAEEETEHVTIVDNLGT